MYESKYSLSSSLDIVGQIELFNFVMAISLREKIICRQMGQFIQAQDTLHEYRPRGHTT